MRLLILTTLLPLLFSFTFRPTSQTIDINNKQRTTQFFIENTTSEIIPVTVKGFRRLQNVDGTEKLPKTTDIQVFPPQLIISPGERKTIRVDWKGPSSLDEERAYRVVAEQVPLKMKKGEDKNSGGIKMLLKYMNVVYVPAKVSNTKLEVLKYQIKGKELHVFIRNSGNTHQYINELSVSFINGKKKINISREDLDRLKGQNILAKTTRVFKFENKLNLQSGLKVSIEHKK